MIRSDKALVIGCGERTAAAATGARISSHAAVLGSAASMVGLPHLKEGISVLGIAARASPRLS
jgi:hypothetical protein